MLRNNDFNEIYNSENKTKNYNNSKYQKVSTSSNIINQYKKLKQSNYLNSDPKLSKTISNYAPNFFNNDKQIITPGLFNKKFYKKKISNNFNFNKNKNKTRTKHMSINNNIVEEKNKIKNNIYNEDTDHSSMETIKKILYNTDFKEEEEAKEQKKEINNENTIDTNKVEKLDKKLNNLFKSTRLSGTFKENKLFNNNYNSLKNEDDINENNFSPLLNNIDFFNIHNTIEKKDNKKNIFNTINKNFTTTKFSSINSMKLLNTDYDYDYDLFENKYNTINNANEDKDILSYHIKNLPKNINYNNNNKYRVRKINTNINININNNNNNKFIDEFKSINYTNRHPRIESEDLSSFKDNNINFDEYFYMKQKIEELTEEINNKNILINEYSNLAKQSKLKFEQLMQHNNEKIKEIEEESKKQNAQLNIKIKDLEKEKKDMIDKDKENQKYISFLEMILFDDNNTDNKKENEVNNINQKFEEILQIKVNDIKKLKKELQDMNDENEKLKNIISKFKSFRNTRLKSMTIDNINFGMEEIIGEEKKLKKDKNDSSINLNQNIKNKYNDIFNSLNGQILDE